MSSKKLCCWIWLLWSGFGRLVFVDVVVLAALEDARRQLTEKPPALKVEAKALRAEVVQPRQEIRQLVDLVASGDEVAFATRGPLAEAQDLLDKNEARLQEVRAELASLKNATVDEIKTRCGEIADDEPGPPPHQIISTWRSGQRVFQA